MLRFEPGDPIRQLRILALFFERALLLGRCFLPACSRPACRNSRLVSWSSRLFFSASRRSYSSRSLSQVVFVAADVFLDSPVAVECQRARHDVIEEPAIVTDEQQGA